MQTLKQIAEAEGVKPETLLVWVGRAGITPSSREDSREHRNLYDATATAAIVALCRNRPGRGRPSHKAQTEEK
jgi:hypothetical protein